MLFFLNREYKFFIPEKKSTVWQILFNCLKCYNVTQGHSCTIFRSGAVGQEEMALGLWSEDIFPGISIQAFSVIYFSVVSHVNLLYFYHHARNWTVYSKSVFCGIFFSLNIHIVYALFFFF